MPPACEEFVHILDEHAIGYLIASDFTILTHIWGEVGEYRVCAEVDADLLGIVAYAPLKTPEGCRPAIAEAVARANYGLRLGKFELDLDHGSLRFRAVQILTDDRVGEAVVNRMIGTTLNMLDVYLPAFLSVIYANDLPKDAIARVEAEYLRPTESENETA